VPITEVSVINVSIRVILAEPEKSGNIGAIARSMKNFDLEDMWIVNPKSPVDSEARAYAMHGLDILNSAKIVETLSHALKDIDMVVGTSSITATDTSNLSRSSITAEELAKKVSTSRGAIGIILGRESSGLNNQEVEMCDFIVTIPASRAYNVLNVATAASIIFYEIFKEKTTTRTVELAPESSKQRLLHLFDTVMIECDMQPHKRKLTQRALRNVISRSFISSREASLLIGAFRKAYSRLV